MRQTSKRLGGASYPELNKMRSSSIAHTMLLYSENAQLEML